jgi:Glycosyl transferase family 2
LLPSGKLNAFVLSASATNRQAELQKLYEGKPNLFARDPQNYLLLCNAVIGTSEENYREFLNRFLAHHKTGEVTSVDFSGNILDRIAFRRDAPISEGPRVSIIISAYNAAATIGYAIRSILDQQYTNIELLICDDASGDTTMSAIRAAAGGDKRVRLFRSRRNQGPYNIRNALLPETSGEYVTFHDADDFALPSRIGLQLKNLTGKKTTADVGRYIRMRPSGETVFFRDRSALRNCLVSIMAAKDAFLRYGPYRSVRFGGDTQFKERIRLAEGDAAVRQLPEPVMLCLWSANSLTQSGGSESFEDGYRGPRRRRIAEITTRQRLLGNAIVPEDEITQVLQEEQIFIEPAGVEIVDRSS